MIRRPIATIRALVPAPGRLAPLFLAMLVAALVLATAQVASGAPQSRGTIAAEAVEESEVEEEEEEEEEIEVELEFEEEEPGGPVSLPPECLLRSAEPRVIARFGRDNLRLSVRYTAELPVRADVAYWLKGSRGTARLGSASRRLGRHGVLTMGHHLDGRTVAKLRAARVIVVQLRVPGVPGFCKRHLTMRLTEQSLLGGSATWYEPL